MYSAGIVGKTWPWEDVQVHWVGRESRFCRDGDLWVMGVGVLTVSRQFSSLLVGSWGLP